MRPALATTGIGSLPFTSVDEALACSLAHDVPFMPELPSLDPREFLRSAHEERPDTALVRRFLTALPAGSACKVQLVGPATLGEGSLDTCLRRAHAMLHLLEGREVLFTLDEPSLRAPSGDHVLLLEELQRAGVRTGLHCCGRPAWDAVLRLPLDVVFLDARLSLEDLTKSPAWPRFVERGGAMGLGVLATSAPPDDLEARCASVLERLRQTTPALDALLQRSYVTPACGLALHAPAQVKTILPQLRRARALLLNEGRSADGARGL